MSYRMGHNFPNHRVDTCFPYNVFFRFVTKLALVQRSEDIISVYKANRRTTSVPPPNSQAAQPLKPYVAPFHVALLSSHFS